MLSNEDIGFNILGYDENAKQILVRPFSSKFKKPLEEYPTLAIDSNTIDPNKDITSQIAAACYTSVVNTIREEAEETNKIADFIKENINTTAVVPTTAISGSPYTIENSPTLLLKMISEPGLMTNHYNLTVREFVENVLMPQVKAEHQTHGLTLNENPAEPNNIADSNIDFVA